MQSIKNTSKKPLSVPLPGGKRLFLGPGKIGQVVSKATQHAPLLALVESGDLEILGEGASFAGRGKKSAPAGSGSQGHTPGKGIFRSGDG